MSDRRPAPGAGSDRPWRDRLDDPDEPLYTVAIAADLFGVDPQTLRRLADAVDPSPSRPSGNQRRYSRRDLERLGRAHELVAEGHHATSVGRIVELEDQLAAGGRAPRRGGDVGRAAR